MKEELEKLSKEAVTALSTCSTVADLQSLEARFLGRKGSITNLLKGLKDIAPEERKSFGQFANKVKTEITEKLDAKQIELSSSMEASGEAFDITLPGKVPVKGSLHPVTSLRYELNDAFLSLGFEVYHGPEVSSELFSFDSLNFPPDHPAREGMDTYWLKGSEDSLGSKRLCLRPHLTGGSVRYMRERKPPFRFVYPGRVYRNESTDAGHERAFYQYEALIVDKKVPFSSGRLLINTILEKVFGKPVKTRMRSGFFPFVEPGFEIDMECQVCGGKGCSVCGHGGWVEMMPGGPPHPNVLRAANLDPDQWQGFYINIGLDRLVMMRHGIDDIRLLHSGDLRFLKQFT